MNDPTIRSDHRSLVLNEGFAVYRTTRWRRIFYSTWLKSTELCLFLSRKKAARACTVTLYQSKVASPDVFKNPAYSSRLCYDWLSVVASLDNIYNGNIFPSLNPAKIFQFICRWTESTKSSAVGPNHRAVINTSNEVKSPLLWNF